MENCKLIGIGGISRSGKSTLAGLLKNALEQTGKKVAVFDQDQFVVSENALPRIRDRIDWEVPESIDWDDLVTRINQARKVNDYVILEGLFAFHHLALDAQYIQRIYLELDKPTFLHRRERERRWGTEPDWYFEHVWESHFKYGLPNGSAISIEADPREQVTELIQKIVNHRS